MAQTTLSVRMDEDVKRRFDAFCAEVGMNASVAINLFAKTVIREHRIPFEISTDPFGSGENQSTQFNAGKETSHEQTEEEDDSEIDLDHSSASYWLDASCVPKPKRKQCSVYLDVGMMDRVKRLAQQRGITIGAVVETCINATLNQMEE